jgi:hypothetical protein
MSIDLVVPTNISPSLQPIQDQNGDASALSVATNAVTIVGQDIAGSALPLIIQCNAVGPGQKTFGRILRLVNGNLGQSGTYDFAVDASGSLQLYTVGNTSNPALTITQLGAVSIPNLAIGTFNFAVDTSGNLQVYAGGQTSNSALTISSSGAVSIPNLAITNLTVTTLTVTKHLSAGT